MKNSSSGRNWFSERKLGLFVHWGLYAIPAWHEQLQRRRRIPRKEYEKLVDRFNPELFEPGRWLDLAQEAGMEYICFTAKHHDGFCMWNTRETDFNVMNTPYGKDVLKMLAGECRRRKFPLCLYYSVADWHHPNYPNRGASHELDFPEEGDEPDLEKYMKFLSSQVRELCTGYGGIHEFWWDMNQTGLVRESVNDMIRSLQPGVVINDRGFDGGDFGTPERESKIGKSLKATGAEPFKNPTEACNSLGVQSWGYKTDEDYYSLRHLIQSIDSVMARGGNYLLNVGPKKDGQIPRRSVQKISSIGKWYKSVSESFSGKFMSDMFKIGVRTDASLTREMVENPGVIVTKNGKDVYIHLNMYPKSEAVILTPITEAPESALLLNNGRDVDFGVDFLPSLWKTGKKYLRLRELPADKFSNQVMVVRLRFK